MSSPKPKYRPSLHDHLFGPGPKRILSLDSGGTLGVIEIAFLEKIEKLLQEQHDDPDLRLCHYFDLIGGTSTGALIATALAMGKTAAEVKKIYFDMAEKVFQGRSVPIPVVDDFFRYRFPVGALTEALGEFVRDEQLQSKKLLTGLAIVAKRLDTGSPWVLTNNPKARYWERREDGDTYIDNKSFKLVDVLRASTAAPMTFIPKAFQIAEAPCDPDGRRQGDPEIGVFVDGAMSPHGNPALKLVMVAEIGKFGFGWRLGPDELHVVSVGAGWHRPKIDPKRAEGMAAYETAVAGARGAVWDAKVHALTQLQWMSRPHTSWEINSEVKDLSEDILAVKGAPADGLFSFQRYDIVLERSWLAKMAPKSAAVAALTDAKLAALTSDDAFTDPSIMTDAHQLASDVAHAMVVTEQFPEAFHLRLARDAPPEVLAEAVAVAQARAKLQAPRPFVVGVVGHRWNRLPRAELSRIKGQLAAVLAEIRGQRPVEAMVLMTGVAEGTDQIAAELALDLGWSLVASLPFSRAEYSKDFTTVDARAALDRVLARAVRVIEAPQADAYADRNVGYAEQGQGLAASADAIVTVWDGQKAHGLGGTQDVIAAGLAKGVRVYWISTAAEAELRRL